MNPKNILRLLSSLIAVVSLAVGCGGGGGSSSSSDVDSGPYTGVTFSITNETERNFSAVTIQDGLDGSVVYEGAFNCAAGQSSCVIDYTGPAFGDAAVLGFQDVPGRTIAYYDTAETPTNYEAIEVSDWSTGAYLEEVLLAWNPELEEMSEEEYYFAWDAFTQSYPDIGTPDDFSERLGAHYAQHQLAQAKSLPEFTFGLAQRLLEYQAANRSEFVVGPERSARSFKVASQQSTAAIVATASQGCPAVVGQLLSSGGYILGSYFSMVTYSVVSSIGNLASGLCTGDDGIDQILTALNNLQNSMDNLQNDLGKLSNFVASAQQDTNIQEFEDLTRDLTQLSKNYKVILRNEGVASLKEYTAKRGGTGADALRNVIDNEPDSVFADLVRRISATSDKNYILKISALTGPKFTTLTRALDLLCASPSTGDIVQLRSQCNMVIATTTSRLVAMQELAEKLAGETYDLLEAYPSEATRYGYDRGVPAARQKADLAARFSQQAAAMASAYKALNNTPNNPGYYPLYAGLSQNLVNNMKSVNCYDEERKAPFILGWYKEAANEYLTTNCRESSTPVKARYHLRYNGSDVAGRDSMANIMGVLVPAQNREPSDLNIGQTPSFNVGMVAMKASAAPKPGTFITNGQNIKRDAMVVHPNTSDGPAGRLTPYLTPWSNETLKAPGLTLYNQTEDFTYGGVYNWLRYTDENGRSFVFYLRSVQRKTSLVCTTTDCTGGSSGLSFREGPQNLDLRRADNDIERSLFGWTIGGSFIDAN